MDYHETVVLISDVCANREVNFHYFVVLYLSTLLWHKKTPLRMCESKLSEWAEKTKSVQRGSLVGPGTVSVSLVNTVKSWGERKPVSVDAQALLPTFREWWQCDLTSHKRQKPLAGGGGRRCRHLVLAVETGSRKEFWVRRFHPVLGFSGRGAKRMENTPHWNRLDSVHSESSTVRPRPANSSELGTQEGVSVCLLHVPSFSDWGVSHRLV